MTNRFAACAMAAWMAFLTGPAAALEEITVAYLQEWPTANQVAQLQKTYDRELGLKVKWHAYPDGNAMTEAIVTGKVQIAYSQGLVPFVVAVSKGIPLKLIGIAVSYAAADNCVVSRNSGITPATAKKLEGKKVGTPIGNVTHYKLLRMLEHLGVDAGKVDIVEMSGKEAEEALANGKIVMGCAFGGPMLRMKENGDYLMSALQQEAIGIRVFDIVTATAGFADKHPDLLRKFMLVTDLANTAYLEDPAAALPIIANAAKMYEKDAKIFLDMFTFPSNEDQVSKVWLGGAVQKFTKQVADFFVAQKQIDKALDSYEAHITDQFVK